MPPKKIKKTKVQLERMLLETIPQTPIPQPYFNIQSPPPYVFPLSSTLLEGIKLLQNYFPQNINQKIRSKLNGRHIQRMSRFKDVYCMMGRGGNGLLVGDNLLQLRGITAFAYGPTHLIISYEDLRLQIYSLQLRLIKVIKAFSTKRITYLKLLSVPKTYESMIVLANVGSKLFLYRIQKSFFSVLAVKLTQQVITDLDFPVTYATQIPTMFRYYLQKDPFYRSCTLLAVCAINAIFIIAFNHAKLDTDLCWKKVYTRRIQQATCSSVSWGQAVINAPSRDISGQKLILNYSFDNKLYFVALRQIQKLQQGGTLQSKCQWIQSYSFELSKRVAFCQQMKKSEVLLITQDNTVMVFHTKNFDIFQKPLRQDQIQMLQQAFTQPLQVRMVSGRNRGQLRQGANEQDLKLLMGKNLSYADTFLYEYPSNQIYFLTQKQFGVYVYCNWKLIADLLKVQQKYECAMIFLIALHKKVNRFDLGIVGQEKQLDQYSQLLTLDFIQKKLGRIRQMPEILQKLLSEQDYLKMIVTPLQFLTETNQFQFLFDVVKDKIIACLQSQPGQGQLIFYKVLEIFIYHGRIKYIPDTQLAAVMGYFVKKDRLDVIDRLAIYFDLTRIDRNIVIQCLLQNNTVVSLAHICTQGNQSQFVTPFVKFWGYAMSHRLRKEDNQAYFYAFRALWYVGLCLQRNWILKQYTFDKYAKMISILSHHFLSQRIIVGLLQFIPTDCLKTLSFYFTIQNSQIINQHHSINPDTKFPSADILSWIERRQGNQRLQEMLSAIAGFLRQALRKQADNKLCLFLSSITIYKTVRFTQQKYLDILKTLIKNYKTCKQLNYGLDDKMLKECTQQFGGYDEEDLVQILSARYINKILTLVYYQCDKFITARLNQLYEESRQYNLTELQAQISFLQGNYNNCIQIYVRSKKAAKILLFQFLQNSFKRLVLQKKKQQKMLLASCIKRQIKYMVGLQPTRTKILVQNYVPQIQQQLIQALADDEQLQLQYLQGIVGDQQRKQMKLKLSHQSILRFVTLMAKYKPDNLIDVFKKNQNFATQDTLKVCQKYEVYDSMQYLYERMGSIVQSVKIAALRIQRILRTRNQYDQQNYAPYIKIKEILDNAIEVCRKNHSQEIWQSLLDSSIQLYHKFKDSDLPADQVEIFFYINGQIMQNLASNCSIEHTIQLLQNKYTNLNMGGKMTKAFINILSNLSHSISILYLATQLVQTSLQKVQIKDYSQKLHSFRAGSYCSTCGFPLTRNLKDDNEQDEQKKKQKKETSIQFRCGHAYHKECAITTQPSACVCCLGDKSDQFTYYLNTLNPQYPKIKKVNQLLTKYEQTKLQMSQKFKIQQYERTNKKQQGPNEAMIQKKRQKFSNFDQHLQLIQDGNWRILYELQH